MGIYKIKTDIELVFSSFKISSFFSMKNRVPFDLRSYIVINLFAVAVKLIALVARGDIYQLELRNFWKVARIQTPK